MAENSSNSTSLIAIAALGVMGYIIYKNKSSNSNTSDIIQLASLLKASNPSSSDTKALERQISAMNTTVEAYKTLVEKATAENTKKNSSDSTTAWINAGSSAISSLASAVATIWKSENETEVALQKINSTTSSDKSWNNNATLTADTIINGKKLSEVAKMSSADFIIWSNGANSIVQQFSSTQVSQFNAIMTANAF